MQGWCHNNQSIQYLEQYDVWGKFSSSTTHYPELRAEWITLYDQPTVWKLLCVRTNINPAKNPVSLYWQLDSASWAIISLAVLQCFTTLVSQNTQEYCLMWAPAMDCEKRCCSAAPIMSSFSEWCCCFRSSSGMQQLRSGTHSVCHTAALCSCSGLQQPSQTLRGGLLQSEGEVAGIRELSSKTYITSNKWTF